MTSSDIQLDKETVERIASIKLLIQKICTPVTPAKRLSSIRRFFEKTDQTAFTQKEYLMIWKGLFYAIWYEEMGKGCEEVIEAIVLASLKSERLLLTGMQTLRTEWKGVDNIRLDKFAFFARRMFNTVIQIEVTQSKKGSLIEQVVAIAEQEPGLLFHFFFVFADEMVKVFEERKDSFSVTAIISLIKPIAALLTHSNDKRLHSSFRKEILMQSLVNLTNSSFAAHVIRVHKWMHKMVIAFADAADSQKIKGMILQTLKTLNNEEEMRVIFEACETMDQPKKRPGKRFHVKRKAKVTRCNL